MSACPAVRRSDTRAYISSYTYKLSDVHNERNGNTAFSVIIPSVCFTCEKEIFVFSMSRVQQEDSETVNMHIRVSGWAKYAYQLCK